MAGVYTVTQINSYIKNMFRQDFVLNRIQIKGEISNCKYHTSGHIYFTLKDSGGTIAVVMFASYASKLVLLCPVLISGKYIIQSIS
jgi:exodeoxyribonuclease VII large subunit